MICGAEIMVKCLELEGVELAFGYPGRGDLPVLRLPLPAPASGMCWCARSRTRRTRPAGMRARAGKPGVCIATSGPGATNLITGIATAYMDSIPLVAITGQVNSELLGRDVFQEADITGACEPFTKHSYLVKRAEDLPRVFKEAFHIASTGRPGPVLIDVPVDVQQAEIAEFHYPEKAADHRLQAAHAGPRDADPQGAWRRSRRRSGPFMCCGGGVVLAGAREELVAFARKQRHPGVRHDDGHRRQCRWTSPHYLGMIGMHGRTEREPRDEGGRPGRALRRARGRPGGLRARSRSRRRPW